MTQLCSGFFVSLHMNVKQSTEYARRRIHFSTLKYFKQISTAFVSKQRQINCISLIFGCLRERNRSRRMANFAMLVNQKQCTTRNERVHMNLLRQ